MVLRNVDCGSFSSPEMHKQFSVQLGGEKGILGESLLQRQLPLNLQHFSFMLIDFILIKSDVRLRDDSTITSFKGKENTSNPHQAL